MKYALVVPDGAADEPIGALGGKTPLQAASTPHLDAIAAAGVVGTVRTVPDGYIPGSDVAHLSLLGYDPALYYTGRAPLEAAARELAVGPTDIVLRCNLTTVQDGRMLDFAAGHISQPEAEQLIGDINQALGDRTTTFHTGVMYRHLVVVRGAGDVDLSCTPPHDIPDQLIADHLPRGRQADWVLDLMDRAAKILEPHPVNVARRERGELPANRIWLWGHGAMPRMPLFQERFNVQGACIAAVDLVQGIARLIGWPIELVPGATGYLDTNYAGKGSRGVELLDDHDLVFVHVEAPDEAGHNGDCAAKISAIESFDEHVVGPILTRLRQFDRWRILVAPDHPTPVQTRVHSSTPPPFACCGTGIVPDSATTFDEVQAVDHGVTCAIGHQLVPWWLGRSAPPF